MNEEMKCPICGEPTSSYMGNARRDRLCRKHAKDFKEGLIEQCPDCDKWHETGKTCECKKEEKEKQLNRTKCIVCGKPANGFLQCKDCYNEMRNHMDSLDKNNSVRQFRDYYYNLKERILIINDMKEVQNQCNKLIAIANVNQNVNEDSSLMSRVNEDVEKLINAKSKIQNTFVQKNEEREEQKRRINTAQDGHNLESDMEVRVDDTLYNACIVHSYGKNVTEILEKRKKADWFIPILNGKGIYIEYWGMDTPKYIEDRKEKEELYKKYNIPYISIEKDDPKQDTQTFTNNLLRDLRKNAIKYFGFMPEWKK